MSSDLWVPGWICIYSGSSRASQDTGRTLVWPHDRAYMQLGELLPSCPQTEGGGSAGGEITPRHWPQAAL